MEKILLVISGGIAAYKSLELIRLLRKAGKQVKCVATKSAMTFITSASVEYLSGSPLRISLEDREQEMKMGHIELARWPDLILVAQQPQTLFHLQLMDLQQILPKHY